MSKREPILATIAQWICSQPDDDEPLLNELHPFIANVIIDAVTSSAAGHGELGSTSVELSMSQLYGHGHFPIWFTGKSASLAGATRCNSRKASIRDLDDGHRKISGHIGAAVVPAVLPVAEKINASWNRVAMTFAIAYNLAIVFGTYANLVSSQTYASGRWCGIVVAGALGYLEKFDVERLAQSMAIAAHTTNGRIVPSGAKFPNHTKEGIAEATVSGLNAHYDAYNGGKGPLDIMDKQPFKENFDIHALLRDWHIKTVYLKEYGCCRWIHPLLDAILELRREIQDIGSIEGVLLETFSRTMTLKNLLEPRSIEDVQFSTQFCAALALIKGRDGMRTISHTDIEDEEVLQKVKNIELQEDPELTKLYPNQVPGRVTITFKNSSPPLRLEVLDPKGEPANPLTLEDQEQKLFSLAPDKIGKSLTAKLYSAFLSVRDDRDLAPLFRCLRKPSELEQALVT